jgi:hypothetical protein
MCNLATSGPWYEDMKTRPLHIPELSGFEKRLFDSATAYFRLWPAPERLQQGADPSLGTQNHRAMHPGLAIFADAAFRPGFASLPPAFRPAATSQSARFWHSSNKWTVRRGNSAV